MFDMNPLIVKCTAGRDGWESLGWEPTLLRISQLRELDLFLNAFK